MQLNIGRKIFRKLKSERQSIGCAIAIQTNLPRMDDGCAENVWAKAETLTLTLRLANPHPYPNTTCSKTNFARYKPTKNSIN